MNRSKIKIFGVFLLAVLLTAGTYYFNGNKKAYAQISPLPQLVKEGSTAYLSVAFYDHTGALIAPAYIQYWISKQFNPGLVVQLPSVCNTTLCTIATYNVAADTDNPSSAMLFTLKSGANYIVNENTANRESNLVSVRFAYGTGCTDFGTFANCLWGTGTALYEVENDKTLWVTPGEDGIAGPKPTPTATPTSTPTKTPTATPT